MADWEQLEEWMIDHVEEETDFSSREYAAEAGLDPEVASRHIQDYLVAQRGEHSNTLYVLSRTPGTRTYNARWIAGARVRNAKLIGKALFDDVRCKMMTAFEPDLRRLSALNPRAARTARKEIEMVIEHALPFLEAAVSGNSPPEEP
jgi:hypothetical protein